MTQISQPWDGRLIGDKGPYSAERWQTMYQYLFGAVMDDVDNAVLPGSGSGGIRPLFVQESAPASASVDVAPGSALVQGVYYRNDADVTLVIAPNTSGNPRIDLVVVRADFALQTVRLAVKQGIPAGSPTAPTLTQTTGVLWEMALAEVDVADSFITIADANITNERYALRATTPPGVYVPYAGAAAPAGWLLCDGAAVSRADYDGLFAVVGTIYGVGDGSTTFNVPDLRGRFPLGKDDMGGSSANRVTATAADNLGQGSGTEAHTLTEAEIPAHTHGQNARNTPIGAANGTVRGDNVNNASGGTTASAGGGGAHNNMPPYLTANFIIKT